MRLLDLFCCAGGASVGYSRAGFEVVGVDSKPQKNYPFEFHQADAIQFVLEHGHEFDAIHASPPCQASSNMSKGTNAGKLDQYEQLIPQTRAALEQTGKPFVIENVEGADMRKDLILCGDMFDLQVIRHRYFELNWPCAQPEHKTDWRKHKGRVSGFRHGEWFQGPYFAVYGRGGGKGSPQQWQDAMGIHWTHLQREISQMLPPAYCEYIGGQLLHFLNNFTV